MTDDAVRRAEQLAGNAEGNVEAHHLIDSDTARPLGAYLRDDEQPHYLFTNVNKGLRLTHPDWDEKRTPYNVPLGHSGRRYLLVTDQRLLFVGGDLEGEDDVDDFPYGPLVDVDAKMGFLKNPLKVVHEDGREIHFFEGGSHNHHIEDAGEYVADRIAAGGTPDEDRPADRAGSGQPPADAGAAGPSAGGGDTKVFDDGGSDDGTTRVFGADTGASARTGDASDADGPAFCPACGHDLGAYDVTAYCPDCGHDLPDG
jgi:hypothetical protein